MVYVFGIVSLRLELLAFPRWPVRFGVTLWEYVADLLEAVSVGAYQFQVADNGRELGGHVFCAKSMSGRDSCCRHLFTFPSRHPHSSACCSFEHFNLKSVHA